MDALVVTIVGLNALFGIVLQLLSPAPSAGEIAWGTLVGLVCTGAIWFRRHRPVLVLTAITLVTVSTLLVPWQGGELGSTGAYPMALYAVAVYRRPALAWVGAGVSFASLVGAALLGNLVFDSVASAGHSIGFHWSVMVPAWTLDAWLSRLVECLVLGLAALAGGVSVHGQREHLAELVRRMAALVAAGEQNASLASMQERSRIAREMHDVVAHSLSVMIALVDGARAAASTSPKASAEALDLLAETGRTALTDMRRMLGVLRDGDTPMAPQPTEADAVAGLVEVFARVGLVVRLRADDLPEHSGLRLTVFRLVQEALTNVLRHAPQATAAEVEVVVHQGSRVEVTVRDDGGQVTEPVGTGGKGLVGMRERAAMYAGEVEAGPVPGGWKVHAVLAVPPPDPSNLAWVRPV